jgi:molybdopterin molybdotransferase
MNVVMSDPGPIAALRDFDGLMPLAVANAAFLAAVVPVPPVRRHLQQALGRVVAEAVRSPGAHPAQRVALRDGYRVVSRDTIGATPYAPAYIVGRLDAVHAGDAMTGGCDAVLPPDAVTFGLSTAEVLQAVAPAAGTRQAGEDLATGEVIVEAGDRLRADRRTVLALAGVASVALRVPRLGIEGSGAIGRMIADLAVAAGFDITADAEADLTVCLCEPGYAATAVAVARFAADGARIAHGLAARPGEAIGLCTTRDADGRTRLIVIVPDRLADALAAWLLIVAPALAALAAATDTPKSETLPLSRKIVSAPGMADLVLLRRSGAPSPAWDPIATGDLTWAALAAADAYCLVPPEREGFPSGTLLTGVFL